MSNKFAHFRNCVVDTDCPGPGQRELGYLLQAWEEDGPNMNPASIIWNMVFSNLCMKSSTDNASNGGFCISMTFCSY
uniref:Uncharacterized protein n=1 Tax=Rhizophora mucronata TaxID=61149 RepID=A0A2P2IMF8_RHIMU